MNNNITLFGGIVTINKAKLDASLSAISYAGLYLIKILLYIASGLFFLLAIASGGDGRINDGNPITMLTMLGFGVFCGLCAHLMTIFMEMIEHGYRVRRIKRKHARINARAKKAI